MSFRPNQFRRHYSDEEGEIGEEEGEIASPGQTPRAAIAPSANPTSGIVNSTSTSDYNSSSMLPHPIISTSNISALQLPIRQLPSTNIRGPRPPPDRGFRRAPHHFNPIGGRGAGTGTGAGAGASTGWPRRSWTEQSTGPPNSGIQRTPSFSTRNVDQNGSDGFRANDPRSNAASRPTDPRNPGTTDATSLNIAGGPLRPTDPRQVSVSLSANMPGETPHRTEPGPTPQVHRSPSLNKPIRNLNIVGGRGIGPHLASNSFNSGPPNRSGIFPNRPGRGIGNRRESLTQQQRDNFHRSEDTFRRPAEVLDPFGRAPRADMSSSTEGFGRPPQIERSNEPVDMFGRVPSSTERQISSDGNFRSRPAADDPGFSRPRLDDSSYNRPRLLDRHQSEPDDSGFGGRGVGPRRFSSYSSLANDHGGPPRMEQHPVRTIDQTNIGHQLTSPLFRGSSMGSPRKSVATKEISEPALESIPRPPFSDGDPRKRAAENRCLSAAQGPSLDRNESRGFAHPNVPVLTKSETQNREQNVSDVRGPPLLNEVSDAVDAICITPVERPQLELKFGWGSPSKTSIPPSSNVPRMDPRTVENRPKAPEIQILNKPEPPKLTCSSLGDPEVVRRAEEAVKELSELVSNPTLLGNDGPSQLPTKQLIMEAMTMLDLKIKDCQASVETADNALSEAILEAAEERQRLAEQQVEEEARKKELIVSKHLENIQRRDQEFIEFRLKLKNEIASRREEMEEEKKGIEESMADRMKQAKSELRKRRKLELKEQVEHAGQSFDSGIEKAQRQVQKATKEAANADTKAAAAVSLYKTKLQERKAKSGVLHLHKEAIMNNLIAKIVDDNKKRAAEAQGYALSLLEVTKSDVNESIDPKQGKTNAEWTTLARLVTGQADALYSDPSESPFFDQINDAYAQIGPIVKEFVRDKNRRLAERWHELAEEYVARTTFYEMQVKKRGATKWKSGSGAKARSHRSSILGFDGSSAPSATTTAIADSGNGGGGGRSTNNPYRRARRGHTGGSIGDVVRSEYEQEQIIAELTAKEAMEKRIAHGGSKLPRQGCQLERELTANYFNTFTHQRVWDPMEEAYELSITNIWTDMEKCIFLDRFMQHPKDFRKIASFLRNKSTRDCIAYYYASKQIVPYKQALKEHLMRRKRRGEYHNWENTIQAALASGARVMAGTCEDKPLVFHLPKDDNTYYTHKLHPMRREVLDAIDVSACEFDDDTLEGVQAKKRKRHKDPWFILDAEQRKYLRQVEKEPVALTKIASDEQPNIARTSSGSSLVSERHVHTERGTPGRKAHKWTADEKRQFFDTIEKHGKNWSLLSSAVESKTMAQIKNYYYDHKKLFGRQQSSHEGQITDNDGHQNQDDQDSQGRQSSDFDDDQDSGRPQHHHQQAAPYPHEQQRQQIPVVENHHEQTLANAELWAQAQLLKQQQEHAAQLSAHEEARRYMQSHSQQQQQVLSNLSSMIPWMTAAQVAQIAALQQHQQQHQQHHVHRHHSASQATVRDWDNEFLLRASNRTPPAPAPDSSQFSPAATALQSMLALRQAHSGHQGFSMDPASQLRSMAALAGLGGMNPGNGLTAPSSSLSVVDVEQLDRARALLEYRAGTGIQADSRAGIGLGVGGPQSTSSAVEALGLLADAIRRAEGNGFNADGQQGNPYNDMNNQRQY